jgi:hypothetical protein
MIMTAGGLEALLGKGHARAGAARHIAGLVEAGLDLRVIDREGAERLPTGYLERSLYLAGPDDNPTFAYSGPAHPLARSGALTSDAGKQRLDVGEAAKRYDDVLALVPTAQTAAAALSRADVMSLAA